MDASLRVKLSDEQRLFIEKALQGENILIDACIIDNMEFARANMKPYLRKRARPL